MRDSYLQARAVGQNHSRVFYTAVMGISCVWDIVGTIGCATVSMKFDTAGI